MHNYSGSELPLYWLSTVAVAVRSHKQTSPTKDDVDSFLKGLFFSELKKSSLQIANCIEKSAFVKKEKGTCGQGLTVKP